jgi:hypothetical protein
MGLLGVKQYTGANREKRDVRAEQNEKSVEIIMLFDDRSEEFCTVLFRTHTKALTLF